MKSTSNDTKGGLEMTGCVNVRDNICAYIDNELSEEERHSFEEHIRSCSECSRELEDMTRIVDLCASLPQKELPDDFAAELHEKLLAVAERQKKNTGSFHRAKGIVFARTVASIAAGVLLIFLTVNFVKYGLVSTKTSGSAASEDVLIMAEASDAIQEGTNEEIIADAGDDTADFNAAADGAQLYFSATLNKHESVDVDRSAGVLEREITKAAIEFAETETIYRKMSTVTVTADEPAEMAETIKVLAEGNGGEEAVGSNQMESLGRNESLVASSMGKQLQLQYVFHQTSYDKFIDVLNDALGANVQMGAFVSEDVTDTLNSMITESEGIDNKLNELQSKNSKTDSDEINELRMQKEKIEGQIEKMRLDSDLVTVTIYINQK